MLFVLQAPFSAFVVSGYGRVLGSCCPLNRGRVTDDRSKVEGGNEREKLQAPYEFRRSSSRPLHKAGNGTETGFAINVYR